jgi:hypothetical protein
MKWGKARRGRGRDRREEYRKGEWERKRDIKRRECSA